MVSPMELNTALPKLYSARAGIPKKYTRRYKMAPGSRSSLVFSSRSSADLRQFVRPGFDRAVQDAPVESLQPPALPGDAAPAQIGGGTT